MFNVSVVTGFPVNTHVGLYTYSVNHTCFLFSLSRYHVTYQGPSMCVVWKTEVTVASSGFKVSTFVLAQNPFVFSNSTLVFFFKMYSFIYSILENFLQMTTECQLAGCLNLHMYICLQRTNFSLLISKALMCKIN